MSYDTSYQRIPPIHPQPPPPPYAPSYVPAESKPTAPPQFGDFGAGFAPTSQQGFLGPQQGYSTQPLYPNQGAVPQPMYSNDQGYTVPPMYPNQGAYPTGPGGYYNAQPGYGQQAGYGQPAGWYGQGQVPGTTTYIVEEERRDHNRMADCCLVACCTLLFCELCHLFSN